MAPTSHSTSTTGFFQTPPVIPNQFQDDTSLQRCFTLFLPKDLQKRLSPDLRRFGSFVLSPAVLQHARSAEVQLPSVQHFDTFGRRVDILTTSEGWRASNAIAAKEGIVSIGYEKQWGHHARLYQFLKTHLWSASSCGVTCPSAMQDGATALLTRRLLPESKTPEETQKVLRSALEKLLSREPGRMWTSGQWMTERPGGSDVRNTETRAHLLAKEEREDVERMVASDGNPLGPYRIDGFKWFSSATDADCTVMLAKTGSGDSEVSAFFAPTRIRPAINPGVANQGELQDGGEKRSENKPKTTFNGIQIQRLKNKLGTKSLPTAELVLSGTRAYMLGQPGQGVKEISSILNITRVHTGVGSCGGWGRGLAVSRAYSRVRKVQGRLLMDVPAHVKALAEQMIEYRGKMLLSYFVVSLLGVVEHCVGDSGNAVVPGAPEAADLLRLLTPVLKSQVSLAAITGLRFCMESLGGVGYLENEEPELNLAKLFRDTCVNAIWEGTTDVLAADCVRVLKGRRGREALAALKNWVGGFMQRAEGSQGKGGLQTDIATLTTLQTQVDELEAMVQKSDADDLLYNGRTTMETISWVVSAVLVHEDAMRDADPVACEIARRWIEKRRPQSPTEKQEQDVTDWRKRAEWDRKIAFGDGSGPDTAKL